MNPDFRSFMASVPSANTIARRLSRALVVLTIALLATTSGSALAQGQMRKSMGSGTGDDAKTSQQAETETEQAAQSDEPDEAGNEAQAAEDSEAAETDGKPPSTGGPDNQIDPGDRIVPSIVRKQRQQYQKLEKVWGQRQVPAGLAGETAPATPRDSGVNSVALEVRNVDFYLDDGVGYHVKHLKAALEPIEAGEPVNFDDPEQYVIHILSGEVLLRPKDLDALFNNYLLTYEPRSLSSVENRTSKDTLEVTVGARLFRFIPPVGGLPTKLSGSMKIADNNWLVYTPESVTQFGMPLKSLISAAQLSLATLTPFDRKGVKLEGNQLLMNPKTVFPPPRLKIDKLTQARLSDEGLTLTFGSDTSDAGYVDPPEPTDSYIWLQSGDARFYSTLLVNANLQLISDSDEPLDFHLYHYRAQSAAGTIRSNRNGALIVRVPNTFEENDVNIHQYSELTPRSANRPLPCAPQPCARVLPRQVGRGNLRVFGDPAGSPAQDECT